MPERNFAKYIVLKVEDIDDCLTKAQAESLSDVLAAVYEYRKEMNKEPLPTYYVINTDEPYAEDIKKILVENMVKR